MGLAYKYTLIDQKFSLFVLNEILFEVEYQSDGSSKTMWKQYLQYPKGFAFWRQVCMRYPTSKKRLVIDCIHYCSSSQIAKNKRYINESPKKLLTVLCTPLGYMFTRYIHYKVKVDKL